MKKESVYLVGTHRYSFRAGEIAKIIGVKIVTPDNLKPRLCYHVEYADGVQDFVQIYNNCDFEIITQNDIINKNVPKIIK